MNRFRPVFQVDIEIYEDKLGQSGDRILSSHITKLHVAWFAGRDAAKHTARGHSGKIVTIRESNHASGVC